MMVDLLEGLYTWMDVMIQTKNQEGVPRGNYTLDALSVKNSQAKSEL